MDGPKSFFGLDGGSQALFSDLTILTEKYFNR